ncbi:hypothetical protein L917_19843 [Phytophthora nicotianae]|uniref:Uncharacterized protein n=1 Tax=Phytophthora nicotianae TaxID=4792 RepID=W2K361_PHYNI|nr:hypothetical protein L917_19843 [Phytophthora nicotianae]
MEKVPDRKERAKISKRKNQSKNAYYKKRSRRPQYQAQAAPYRIGKQIYHVANIVPRLMGSCSENAEFIPESRGDDDGSSPPMLYTGEDWHSGNGDVPYDVVQWPANIERLHQYFNPNDIKFDFTPAFGVCGCEERCTVFSCATAKLIVFARVGRAPVVPHNLDVEMFFLDAKIF